MGCILAGCCRDDKNNYQELEGRKKKRNTTETRREQQERRGVPRDPNSRNSHRRHDMPREEIEMKTFLPPESECRRCDAGDGDGDDRSIGSVPGSTTSVSASEKRKLMLDAAERRHQKQQRLDEIIQQKRSREEKMEKRERELATMGGTKLRWQM